MRLRSAVVLALICVTEFVCLAALISPIFGGISLRVAQLSLTHATNLSIEDAKSVVLWTGAGAALLSNILFGWLGDRLVAAGRGRAVLVVVGAVAGAAALCLAPTADSLAGVK